MKMHIKISLKKRVYPASAGETICTMLLLSCQGVQGNSPNEETGEAGSSDFSDS